MTADAPDTAAGDSVAAFDLYARNYDQALNQGLAVSGEGREYFARGRVEFLAKCLGVRAPEVRTVLDYGCGTGDTSPLLARVFPLAQVTGFDVSEESLNQARRRHESDRVRYVGAGALAPAGNLDLVYCNGIFHHIPPPQRARVVQQIARALRPGGCFALWENNPWNPGTRLVMKRIPFDRDAIVLSAPEARRLVTTVGLRVLRTDFMFIFPRSLRWLRRLEAPASRLPLGAQYQILCVRPPFPETLQGTA